MKFSVLMSVYIKEKPSYLKSALNSVFNQSLKPAEVVLVEDGPLTDALENVIEEFKQKYKEKFKVIKLSQNVGLGKALNEGLKHCKYEYVARMDTDDICYKNRFKKQIEYLEKHKDIAVLGTNIVEYDEYMENRLFQRDVPSKTEEIKKYITKRNPMNHVTVIFKKSAIIQAGGYMHCEYFEDYYLWCRVFAKGYKLENIKDELVKVRGGQEMIERRGGFKYVKSIFVFQKKILKLGIINYYEFVKNLILRVPVAIIPNNLRKIIYKNILRK